MAEENKKPETEETKHRPSEVGVENKAETKPEKREELKEETPKADSPKTEPVLKEPEIAKKASPSVTETEREYIIPLRKRFNKVPRYKRTNKAVKTVKEFLVRHMKVYDRDLKKIKIDQYLNEFLWFRGIRKPPAKVKVRVSRDGENVRVYLADMPDKIKFKKERLERREQKAIEFIDKKKASQQTLAQKAKEKLEDKVERPEEEKEEEKEKARAGEEAMQKIEKAAAKTTKHMVGGKTKEPKRPQRKALAK